MAFPQILVDFQSYSIDILSFSISFSQFQSVSVNSLSFFSLVFLFPWCFSCCEILSIFWVFSVYFSGFGLFEVFLGIFEKIKEKKDRVLINFNQFDSPNNAGIYWQPEGGGNNTKPTPSLSPWNWMVELQNCRALPCAAAKATNSQSPAGCWCVMRQATLQKLRAATRQPYAILADFYYK